MIKLQTAPAAADVRSAEILDSARAVFAAKGFDGASMQDLAQAAGMSAGNFYRYFPSKDAIIEAMVQRDLTEIEGHFSEIMRSPDPMTALRAALHEHLDCEDCDDGAIWAEIVSASKRRAQVGAIFQRMETLIIGYLIDIFGRVAGLNRAEAEAQFTGHATMVFMLVQGVKMRLRQGQDHGPEFLQLRDLAARVIDRVLAEVAATPAHPEGTL